MAISIKRYVDITSAVGAGVNVGERQLIGRFFDDNALIPTNSHVEFTAASDVSAYFGSNSVEYARAAFYFGWVSKNDTAPKKMSFARWNSAASAPQIFGAKGAQSLASWQGIAAGSFSLTLGATTHVLTGLNFGAVASLADVAAVVQTALHAQAGTMWTSAVVTYDATRASFDLTGGQTGAAAIAVAAGSGGSDIAGQLGWLAATAILSAGENQQSITTVLSTSAAADNNFGSFAFLATLTQDQIVEAATWNDTQNNMFMYSVPVTTITAVAVAAAVANLSGVTLTLAPLSTQYPEQAPMMILAATDYTARNSVQNYMFQTFSLSASVVTDADATTYDALRVNYYGQTQTAGQLLQFYQRGYMMGLSSDALDQNTYGNEMWLKDAAGAAIMTLLLALSKVSANIGGRAQLFTIMQGVISQALFNGTISVGKTLSDTQKLFISQTTGDSLAWKQVQNIGYWLDIVFKDVVVNGNTEKQAVYTLIYSKDDVIRKVQGSDILI